MNPLDQLNAGRLLPIAVDVDETIGGMHFTGTVSLRYPSVSDSIQIGIKASQFRAGVPIETLDALTVGLTRGRAELEVLCISAPAWAKDLAGNFQWENLPSEVVLSIYYAYIDKKEFLRAPNDGSDTGDAKAPGGEAPVSGS